MKRRGVRVQQGAAREPLAGRHALFDTSRARVLWPPPAAPFASSCPLIVDALLIFTAF